ncbi:short-chain dehydrogenase [Variovorax paradoxus]|jgi:NAD(P)-dependent dehydrogenase (short-subunit alcohol dehydrogenase family)|uniref:SDR family NAD(P)-dependent oxidoreductase n=1 Tax=Variovorax paradoxus TaxID=34073 RepID=UPI0006E50A14|nr:short-chain dehydrogenase [Variovorax paradoxus]KPV07985.1 short-chain dehydrogenase [Variovorax paradoxus]KPV11823.1 short-chain dehydrogenase [Variovorax paradoxus]KPV23601.1 short-chain dehydrogenase [Variovorax paradoxus]KPV36564.1 short-chain dehydrogenase [Variovorax paradoxus]
MNAVATPAPRRLIVSGGASGIGLAVARMAVARGARVALLDRDTVALADAVRLLGEAVLALECDVSDAPAVRTAVDRAAQWLGGVDALVNSAGIDALKSLETTSDEEWARVLAVNLTGPMLVCRAALPHLRAAGGGSIVNIASGAGLRPLPNRTAYCASKAAVIMFGKSLAIETAADGIRVNAVCPGAIDTPLFRTSYENADDPERALAEIRERYALGRIAAPEEVAEAVLYLSGPGASYITGTALAVDGGRTFH